VNEGGELRGTRVTADIYFLYLVFLFFFCPLFSFLLSLANQRKMTRCREYKALSTRILGTLKIRFWRRKVETARGITIYKFTYT
jgi:hypothetical protein